MSDITIVIKEKCGMSFRDLVQEIFNSLNPRDWQIHEEGSCGFLNLAYTNYDEIVKKSLPDSEIMHYLCLTFGVTWDDAHNIVMHFIKLGFLEVSYTVSKFSPYEIRTGPWVKLLRCIG